MKKFFFQKIINFILNILLSAATLIIIFSSAEILCRIYFDKTLYTEPGPMTPVAPDYYDKKNGLSYRISGNSLDEEKYLSFNADWNAIKKEKDKGEFRVIAIGDSYTAGAGVNMMDHKEGYVPQLRELLKKKNSRYEVFSITEGGLNAFQELTLFKEMALKYHPDLIVWQTTNNDTNPPRSNFAPGRSDGIYVFSNNDILKIDNKLIPCLPFLNRDLNFFILKNSAFFRFLSYKLDIAMTKMAPDEEIFFDSVREMIKMAGDNKIKLIIAHFTPASAKANFCDSADEYGKRSIKLTGQLKQIALENKITYFNMCDLAPDLKSIKSDNENPASLEMHYNNEGYRIAAEALAREILK